MDDVCGKAELLNEAGVAVDECKLLSPTWALGADGVAGTVGLRLERRLASPAGRVIKLTLFQVGHSATAHQKAKPAEETHEKAEKAK